MPGPIDSLRFVHAAILKEAEDLEAAVAAAVAPADVGDLAGRIALFAELVDGHTRGEEKGLFPPLVERDEAIAETYLFDHTEERELFAELVGLAEACALGEGEALDRMRRQVVALATHTHSHVTKENELILPRVAELFGPEEQGRMVADILSVFTPEQTARGVPWIVGNLDADTAAAYVGALSVAMPPPVFDMARGWIRDGVSDEHWQDVAERCPALAG